MMTPFVIARKESSSFSRSWMGVLTYVFFYLLSGVFFALLVMSYARISLDSAEAAYENLEGLGLTRFVFSSWFLNMSAVLLFLVPVLSMRAFSEERRSQTYEFLFTYPLSDFDIVWGKFLGMIWIFEMLFLPSLGYLFLMHWLGGTFDWGPVLTGYLGFWLLGNAYLSIGIFVSSLTESHVVSALVTFSALIFFWVFDWTATLVGGTWSHIFSALSPLGHYRDFTLGILDLSHLVYFVFFHFFFLFLTLRSVETRNWKG